MEGRLQAALVERHILIYSSIKPRQVRGGGGAGRLLVIKRNDIGFPNGIRWIFVPWIEAKRARYRTKSKVCAKVEHVFLVIKRIFG